MLLIGPAILVKSTGSSTGLARDTRNIAAHYMQVLETL